MKKKKPKVLMIMCCDQQGLGDLCDLIRIMKEPREDRHTDILRERLEMSGLCTLKNPKEAQRVPNPKTFLSSLLLQEFKIHLLQSEALYSLWS